MAELPDPITLLEALLPGNPFRGEPPLPRGLVALLESAAQQETPERAEVPPPVPRVETSPAPDLMEKPGCTAAETTILTLGFLDGLAEGMEGFGVLRQGKEYLEKGARAAQFLGYGEVARQMREIAAELPEVHDPEQARVLAQRLRPLKEATWEMGRKCKGTLSTEAIRQARQLAEDVRQGRMTLEAAVHRVRSSHGG